MFEETHYPDVVRREAIASKVDLKEERVEVSFNSSRNFSCHTNKYLKTENRKVVVVIYRYPSCDRFVRVETTKTKRRCADVKQGGLGLVIIRIEGL